MSDDEKEFEKTIRSYRDRLKEVKKVSSMDNVEQDEMEISSSSPAQIIPTPETPRPLSSFSKGLSAPEIICQLGEFASLHRYFLFVAKHKLKKNPEECDDLAMKWVQCWQMLGYTYRNLLTCVATSEKRVSEKLCPPDELQRRLWSKLNSHRDRLPTVSLSYVVDRTIEHFKLVIAKRMKEREDMDTSVRLSAATPKTEAQSPLPSFTSTKTESLDGSQSSSSAPQAEVTSSTSLGMDQLTQIQHEFYEFLKQKLFELIRVPRDTSVALDQVRTVIQQTQLHPSTLLAWYEIDCESNDGKMLYFPELLHAYFQPNSIGLPNLCGIDTLSTFVIEFCLSSNARSLFKNTNTYAAYSAAVQTLLARKQLLEKQRAEIEAAKHRQEMSRHQPYKAPPPPHIDLSDTSESLGSHSWAGEPLTSPSQTSLSTSSERSSSMQVQHPRQMFGGRSHSVEKFVEKKDPKLFQFVFGKDCHLSTKSGHPLFNPQPLPSSPESYLKVFCHTEVLGEGLVSSDCVQIGMCLENCDDETLFPIAPTDHYDYPKTILKQLCLVSGKGKRRSEEEIKFCHPIFGDEIECQELSETLFRFVNQMKRALRRTDYDGVLLVFGYEECLLYLLRAIIHCDSVQLKRKFCAVVKGYCVLEDPIRKHFLKRCDEHVRLSVDVAWNIVFGTTRKRYDSSAEAKATAFCKVYERLISTGFEVSSACRLFEEHTMDTTEKYISHIKRLKPLRRNVTKSLDKYSRPLLLDGIFQLFPNLGCQESFESAIDKAKAIAALFVEYLVASDLHMNNLYKKYEQHGHAALCHVVKTALLTRLPEQTYVIDQIIDICVSACVTWIDEKLTDNVRDRKRKSRKRKRHQAPSPATDLETTVSISDDEVLEMKDEELEEKPLDLFRELHEALISRLIDTFPPTKADEIGQEMIDLWLSCGYKAESLENRIQDGILNRLTLHEQFKFTLSKREKLFPSHWNGYGLDFLIEQTINFFSRSQPTDIDITDFVAMQRKQSLANNMNTDSLNDDNLALYKTFAAEFPKLSVSLKKYCKEIIPAAQRAKPVINRVLSEISKVSLSVRALKVELISVDDRKDWKAKTIAKILQATPEDELKLFKKLLSFLLDLLISGNEERNLDIVSFSSRGVKREGESESSQVTKRTREELEATGVYKVVVTNSWDFNEQSTLKEVLENYLAHRNCPADSTSQTVHEYIFFHPLLRRLKKYLKHTVLHITDDFTTHLSKNVGDLDRLKHKEIDPYNNLPESCQNVRGTLTRIIQSFCDRCRTYTEFSEAVYRINFGDEMEDNNGVPFYRLNSFIARSMLAEVEDMLCSKELEGFELNHVDQNALLMFTSTLVTEVANRGFNVASCLNALLFGQLESYLKSVIQRRGPFTSGFNKLVFSSLCHEWIYSTLIQKPFMRVPFPDKLRKIFKTQLVRMIPEWQLLRDYKSMTCNLPMTNRLRQKLMDFKFDYMVQKPIAPVEEKEFMEKDSNLSEIASLEEKNIETVSETESQVRNETGTADDIIMETSEVSPGCEGTSETIETPQDFESENSAEPETPPSLKKKEKDQEEEEHGEIFLQKLGYAKTIEEMELQPGCEMIIKLSLCGMPRIKPMSNLVVHPMPERLTCLSIEMETIDHQKVLHDYKFYVKVINRGFETTVKISKGSVLAKVKLANLTDVKPSVGKSDSPFELIRYVVRNWGPSEITDSNEQYLALGQGFESQILSCASSGINIYRSKVCSPGPLTYTFKDIVFFLKKFSCLPDYEIYLLDCFEAKVNFVRFNDINYIKGIFFSSFSEKKRKDDDFGAEDTKHQEISDIYGLSQMTNCDHTAYLSHLEIERKVFPEEVQMILSNIIAKQVDLSQSEAERRLNLFLSVCHGVGMNLTKLKFEGFTSASCRAQFENALFKLFQLHYRRNPEIFHEHRLLTDDEALHAIARPKTKSQSNDLEALISLFKSQDEDLASLLISQLENHSLKKCFEEDMKQFFNLVSQKKKSEIIKEDKVTLYLCANDRMQSFLLVVEKDKITSLVECGSQFIMELDINKSMAEKVSSALPLAIRKRLVNVKDCSINIVVDRQSAVCHVESLEEDFETHFEITICQASNPARPLCSRDLGEKPYFSHLNLVKEILNITISVLCSELKESVKNEKKKKPLTTSDSTKEMNIDFATFETELKEWSQEMHDCPASKIDKQFQDLQLYIHHKLLESNLHCLSSEDIISAWTRKSLCDFATLQLARDETQSERDFRTKINKLLCSLEASRVPRKLILDLTTSFFFNPEAVHPQLRVKSNVKLELKDGRFDNLGYFFRDVLNLMKRESTSDAYIHCWKVFGLEFDSLFKLFVLTWDCAQFQEEIYKTLSSRFTALAVCLKPDVDFELLFRLTGIYFKTLDFASQVLERGKKSTKPRANFDQLENVVRKKIQENQKNVSRKEFSSVFSSLVIAIQSKLNVEDLAAILKHWNVSGPSTLHPHLLVALHYVLTDKFPELKGFIDRPLLRMILKYLILCEFKLESAEPEVVKQIESSADTDIDVEEGEVLSDDDEDMKSAADQVDPYEGLLADVDDKKLKFGNEFKWKPEKETMEDVVGSFENARETDVHFANVVCQNLFNKPPMSVCGCVFFGERYLVPRGSATNFKKSDSGFYLVDEVISIMANRNKNDASNEEQNIKNFLDGEGDSSDSEIIELSKCTRAWDLSEAKDLLIKLRTLSLLSTDKETEMSVPNCEDETYQLLYAGYFKMCAQLQMNMTKNCWRQTCENVAQTSVAFLKSAGLSHEILRNLIGNVCKESEPSLKKEKFRSGFQFLLDCFLLRQFSGAATSCNHTATFVQNTIEIVLKHELSRVKSMLE